MAGRAFGIPVRGTLAHSWVESFPSELESFQAYAKIYPKNCLLLVDTYDTLRSGVPNAIRWGRNCKERKKATLQNPPGQWRPDVLKPGSRRMLDETGFQTAHILGSSDLDEGLIESIKKQGAQIDMWGVGTRLVTSYSCPALGGVYKLSAIFEDGYLRPKLKISTTRRRQPTRVLKK